MDFYVIRHLKCVVQWIFPLSLKLTDSVQQRYRQFCRFETGIKKLNGISMKKKKMKNTIQINQQLIRIMSTKSVWAWTSIMHANWIIISVLHIFFSFVSKTFFSIKFGNWITIFLFVSMKWKKSQTINEFSWKSRIEKKYQFQCDEILG